MSTLFFLVAKRVLSERIKKIHDESVAADLSVSGIFRGKTLSEAKQDLIIPVPRKKSSKITESSSMDENDFEEASEEREDGFLSKWKKIQACESDAKTYEVLDEALMGLRDKGWDTAEDYDMGESQFGRKLLTAIEFLKFFYRELKKNDMLDVEYVHQPLEEFMFEAALYIGYNLADYHIFMRSDSEIPNPAVFKAKLNLIGTTVKETSKQVAIFRETKTRENWVHEQKTLKNSIIAIKTSNTDICRGHSKLVDLPKITLSTFFGFTVSTGQSVGPGVGELEKHMDEALRKISRLQIPKFEEPEENLDADISSDHSPLVTVNDEEDTERELVLGQ